MKKFSIFLPVRNGWPYIKECVESILRQTYPHFELNVLDNQSSDGTLDWLESLRDSRVKISTANSSLTIEESWARVKSLNKYQYMTLIGHDDIFDPSFLSAINALIEEHPEAGLYFTGSRLINSNGKRIRSCYPVPACETPAQYLASRFIFRRDVFGTGYVMRSVDYDRLGGIPPFEKLFFADDALWLSLLSDSYMATDCAEHFSVRIHAGSESASISSTWRFILKGLGQFANFLEEYSPRDEKVRNLIENLAPNFFLSYHRNAYIYALIEASQLGIKINPKLLDEIEASLISICPSMKKSIRNSAKVMLIESLNAMPLRRLIPYLWDAYYKLRTKA